MVHLKVRDFFFVRGRPVRFVLLRHEELMVHLKSLQMVSDVSQVWVGKEDLAADSLRVLLSSQPQVSLETLVLVDCRMLV